MPPPLIITGFSEANVGEDDVDAENEDGVDNTADAMFLRAALDVENVADALRNVVDPINIFLLLTKSLSLLKFPLFVLQ